ncbi:branched-chain amino acid ABC transporter permease [Spirochaetia bacterium 38H-sp]|uniref:Branched-chain amino acid ABC transporter permease n=1 Tax=Rarispira pelagica TaxID=3141764 RepID=A0ABU9U8R0_9SPIR
MEQFFQQTINGVALGGVYALIAIGYTMIYGIIKLINFAHGDILMLGAFFAYFVLRVTGPTPEGIILAFVVSMTGCAILGITIERLAYKPLRTAPRINALITAIGVSLLIENVARVLPFIGPDYRTFPVASFEPLRFAGIVINPLQLIVLIVALVLMAVLTYIVDYTKVGKAMRAVSFDKQASALMGINVNRIISFTFALGSMMAAAAGILYSFSYPLIEPNMGIIPGLKAFVAAVLGGIGSIPGAMIGGFIMGLAETYTKGYISSQMADAIAFGILIVILLVKPTGLLGKKISEKV